MDLVSFRLSAVRPDELSAVLTQYLALERIRIIRRLLIPRCALVVVAIALIGGGYGWLPRFATWLSAGVFVALPAVAWTIEIHRARQLAHRLSMPGPHGATKS
jgi:hypothetical protein